jgi:putative flavoprotein involved in K+ transport
VSRALQLKGLRHVVLERHRICETWRTQRWDAFRMNTPNVQTVMPGDRDDGDDPQGFMTRDEFVAKVSEYASRYALPVRTGTPVSAVRPDGRGGFQVQSSVGSMRAAHVVFASGNLNRPRRPVAAPRVPPAQAHRLGSEDRGVHGLLATDRGSERKPRQNVALEFDAGGHLDQPEALHG